MSNKLLKEILQLKKEFEVKLDACSEQLEAYFEEMMKKAVLTLQVPAMAFHYDFISAWNQAGEFSGTGGRVATLPDIVGARLVAKPESFEWKNYFTTSSAEYMGFSRGGNRILIVAHGIGPMSTLKGILKAYSYEIDDYKKSRERRGGRISIKEFRNLEDGKYGEVSVVDMEALLKRYEYPFLEYLTASQTLSEPLLKARFGPKAGDYIKCISLFAQDYHRKNGVGEIADPYILQMRDAANCSYMFSKEGKINKIGDKSAFAHLLSIGGLADNYIASANYDKYPEYLCLISEVGCHEWSNNVRLVGIRPNIEVKDIHPGTEI